MNFQISRWLLALTLSFSGALALAADATNDAMEKQLRAALELPGTGISVKAVSKSAMPGLYEVELVDGTVLQSTAAGDYFIVGDLYSVDKSKGLTNLSETRRDGQRLARLESVAANDMIVFPAEGERRAYINVFTDVTCYYCRKLHQEVPELNKRGVEVRYLAYPRQGVGTDGYQKLVTAWCSDDKQDALTRLKAEKSVASKSCSENPVTAQFQLGKEVGVRGTPAIVTQDGKLISGYQPADRMMVTLGLD
ncbi:MAG: DsbC family protein [Halioglobus sp.]|nr:DsbC family protein [Halioglobus sp.]